MNYPTFFKNSVLFTELSNLFLGNLVTHDVYELSGIDPALLVHLSANDDAVCLEAQQEKNRVDSQIFFLFSYTEKRLYRLTDKKWDLQRIIEPSDTSFATVSRFKNAKEYVRSSETTAFTWPTAVELIEDLVILAFTDDSNSTTKIRVFNIRTNFHDHEEFFIDEKFVQLASGDLFVDLLTEKKNLYGLAYSGQNVKSAAMATNAADVTLSKIKTQNPVHRIVGNGRETFFIDSVGQVYSRTFFSPKNPLSSVSDPSNVSTSLDLTKPVSEIHLGSEITRILYRDGQIDDDFRHEARLLGDQFSRVGGGLNFDPDFSDDGLDIDVDDYSVTDNLDSCDTPETAEIASKRVRLES